MFTAIFIKRPYLLYYFFFSFPLRVGAMPATLTTLPDLQRMQHIVGTQISVEGQGKGVHNDCLYTTTRIAFPQDLESFCQDSLSLCTRSEMGMAEVCPTYGPFSVFVLLTNPSPSHTCFGYAIPLTGLQVNQTGLSTFLSAKAALCTLA